MLLLGCSGDRIDTNVYVSAEFLNKNIVKIDDTLTLKQNQRKTDYIKFVIKSGKHTISINGNKSTIKIGEGGGILNLEKCDFVIFPIKYDSNDEITSAMINTDFPIVLDSIIIYKKNLASNQVELIKLLKNPIAKDLFSYHLEKIDKDQLFIDKNWDYGINDSIPEYITVETTAEKGNVEKKRKVVNAKTFLLFAKLCNNYNVELIKNKELIELINNFKKE